jgi:aminopeptidase N
MNRLAGPVLALVLVAAGTTSCDADSKAEADDPTTTPASTQPATTHPAGSETDPDDPALEVAESMPLEDSVYPNVGDPGVDSLHYDLDLAWDPETLTLDGTAALAFRATTTAQVFRLDFGDPLEVETATLDGVEVETLHNGKDLVIQAPVTADEKYLLEITYTGSPEPAPAPTTRSDFSTTGWTVTESGEVWTMQEPYGAFTWYPVNDQPSDKALYDFTITAPEGWVGVANGELVGREDTKEGTVTTWHVDAPASSYLVTIAIGDLVMTEDKTPSGVPLTYWTPRGDANALQAMRVTPGAIDWIEGKLGRYPFSTLGSIVVDSSSAMETQSMVTYGNTSYTLSEQVIVHELVHQWYGDIVSPTDWSDVWMNEGMTLYLAEGVWASEHGEGPLAGIIDYWSQIEPGMRKKSGPPGDYDPRNFGEGNIYYGPALMWHSLRQRIGDDAFWAMVKKWPTVRAGESATRGEFLDWVEQETGAELTSFFDAWLLGQESPEVEQ